MSFIKVLIAIIFGVVEGITEWLPISSTGHMILLNEFLTLEGDGISDEFVKLFMIVIQLGAILAVVVVFWKKLWPFCADRRRHFIKPEVWKLWFHILVACIPFGILGLLFDDMIDRLLGSYLVVGITLILYGILFIVVERSRILPKVQAQEASDISYLKAFLIGLIQSLAMIPGTSRSGVSIVGSMLLGCSRVAATEFSFYLAIPAMVGSSGYKVLKYVSSGYSLTSPELAVLIIGMLVAFVVSLLAIRFLVGYLRRHDLVVFGRYRIVLGILVIGYFTLRAVWG